MRLLTAFLLAALSFASADDCNNFTSGKLVAADQSTSRSGVQNTYNGVITPINWNVSRIKIQFSDMAYTVEYTRGPKVSTLTVGDPIDACVAENNVVVKLPNKTFKAKIISKERVK